MKDVKMKDEKNGRRRISDDWLVAILALVLYLGVGAWLISQDIIFPDSMSRVANGYYVVFSRDPHLAAIGFVWNPLPSLAAIPLLLLSPLIPVLASKAFAGVIVSAICGALAMVSARRLLALFGVGRGAGMVLTGILAIQPLILLSASTGASESMLLAVALYTTLHLTRWLREDDPWHLAHAGFGLGLAYLVRYEAVAAALMTVLVVLGLSLWRSRGGRRARTTFLLDCFLVGGPFAASFGAWALASRLVAGSWFETYTSLYGNTAQVTSAREAIDKVTGGNLEGILAYLGTQLFAVAPFALLFVVIAMVIAALQRDAGVLGSAAVLGGVLAFDEWAFMSGSSFGWLRFQLMAIPWGVVMAGYILAALREGAGRLALRRIAAWTVLIATLAPLPLAWWASLDSRLAREENLALSVARGGQYVMQDQVAAYLDSLDLPEGSVITDVAYSFPIVLASRKPKQFVITPDRDFKEKLINPVEGRVRYALVTDPASSTADAVALRFPGIYEDGCGVATLEREWRDGRGASWRLYAFNGFS